MTAKKTKPRTIVVIGPHAGHVRPMGWKPERDKVLAELKAAKKEKRDAVIVAEGYDLTIITWED